MRQLEQYTRLRLRDWRDTVDREQASRYTVHRLRRRVAQLRRTAVRGTILGAVIGAAVALTIAHYIG